MLDIFVHQLLVLAIFLAGLLAFMELLIRTDITVELLRTSFVFLQGSWLWQVSWGLQLIYLVSPPLIFSHCLVGHCALKPKTSCQCAAYS